LRRSIAVKWQGGGCLGCGCGCVGLIALGVLLLAVFGALERYAGAHENAFILIAVAVLLLIIGLLLTGRGKSFVRAQIAIRKRPPRDSGDGS
jgi:hypothetical protein